MFDYTLYGRGEVADEKRLLGREESDVTVNPRIHLIILFIIGTEKGVCVPYRFGCNPIEVIEGDSGVINIFFWRLYEIRIVAVFSMPITHLGRSFLITSLIYFLGSF